jgi:hypothetical protein
MTAFALVILSCSACIAATGDKKADEQARSAHTLPKAGNGPASTATTNPVGSTKPKSSDKDIKSAYGSRDTWQVIDAVPSELGTGRSATSHTTPSASGAAVMKPCKQEAGDKSREARTKAAGDCSKK